MNFYLKLNLHNFFFGFIFSRLTKFDRKNCLLLFQLNGLVSLRDKVGRIPISTLLLRGIIEFWDENARYIDTQRFLSTCKCCQPSYNDRHIFNNSKLEKQISRKSKKGCRRLTTDLP